MDKAYIAVLSFAFLFLLHYILGKKSNGSKGAVQLPPSPPAIPFFGHLHLVEKPLHAALCRLGARYGPVFSLRLGARNAVVVSSPACARECFTEHDVAFANRPQFPSQMLVSYGGTSLVSSSYGPHWRNLRRVAAVRLLSAHRVAGMSGGGAARVELKRSLFELSLSVLMETIAQTKGTRPEADGDTDMSLEAQEFKQVVDEIIPLIGAANVWDYLPVMRWFDVSGVRSRILATVSRRDAFLHRLIDAERRRMDEGGAGDEGEKKSMIAVLLTLQKTEPELYTDQMIIALCANLFVAGTETTSTTIEWAMSLLLNHPAALKKAQAEMDASIGASRMVAADDVPRLSYLQCIINETLRLYPAAPLLLPHESSADCKVGGYDVPSGTMLIVNAYAIHRDPAVWEDPAAFRPERFEDGKADGLLLMPFGMGRRRCPGETLALQTVGVVLGTLVQCFDWDRVDGAEVDMTEGVGITMPKAVALEAVCRPRAAMGDVLQKL
ncbi:unnamed protein product [Triticum turgidum subsp. durum]|uniref:Cytochrome P450 n=1 Tax=Triticum turgidum subsp. durum TaxID=4567 RepID=A0A9R1AR16_TRITD|nr:unnamed protein product [Triticum turgidum subsp. durum]